MRAEFHLATLHLSPFFLLPICLSPSLHIPLSHRSVLCLSISNLTVSTFLPFFRTSSSNHAVSLFSNTACLCVSVLRGWNTNSQPTSDSEPKATGHGHPPIGTPTWSGLSSSVCVKLVLMPVCLHVSVRLLTGKCLVCAFLLFACIYS